MAGTTVMTRADQLVAYLVEMKVEKMVH